MRPECLFSTSLLYKILPTNLVPCKLAVFTFYTCYLRYTVLWGFFFLIQTSHRFCSFLPYLNLYFCSFSHFCKTNNIVLFQYSGRWKHALSMYNFLLYRIDHIVCTHRLFYFSFRSLRKHRRARSARTSCRFVLYRAGLRDFEKIEGMWTGYWPHHSFSRHAIHEFTGFNPCVHYSWIKTSVSNIWTYRCTWLKPTCTSYISLKF